MHQLAAQTQFFEGEDQNNQISLGQFIGLVGSNPVILGDQSPLAGGFLRFEVLRSLGMSPSYLHQDVDSPWQGVGSTPLAIVEGWNDYWSTAARFPFSISSPTVNKRILESFRASSGSPDGLQYLAGPNGSATYRSEAGNNPKLIELTKQINITEIMWAAKVAELKGDATAVQKAQELLAMFESMDVASSRAIYEQTMSLHDEIAHEDLGSFVLYFRDNPPLLMDRFPRSDYWAVTVDGGRRFSGEDISDDEFNFRSGKYIWVPKGKVLPLELAARGYVFAFTGLGYIPTLVEMRDSHVPELKFRFAQIRFNWDIGVDPYSMFWEQYVAKKLVRKKSHPGDIPEEVAAVRQYWNGRPTSLSLTILGGDLNPTINYFTY